MCAQAKSGRNTSEGYGLLAPTLVVMGLVLAAPLLLMAITSLKSQSGLGYSQPAGPWPSMARCWGAPAIALCSVRSVPISGAVTLATVVLAYPMAYFVAFHAAATNSSGWSC